MSKRQESPDLLIQALGAGVDKPARQIARDTDKKRGRPPKPTEDEPRIKATHALKASTMDRLDESLLKLRRELDNRGLSRYEIVEAAILLALDELDSKGAKSAIAQKLR